MHFMFVPLIFALQYVVVALPVLFIFSFVLLGVGIVYLLIKHKTIEAICLFNTLLLLAVILILLLPR